ncbi:methyl-accepting chemotaxis protein [Aquabacterium sp. A7-Y]|uniref:methyl-accepting chemotaxis protein n=1 Tax=Aquabacterium sp. A7-Y TaxID=1349605 RepID=UPI002AC8444E|nr:methyl-accepting chemotaxis protein [Aquabacterium sp. A7-Y]
MPLMSFFRLSVARRLAFGFSSLVLMLLGVAALNGLEFRNMAASLRQIVEVNDPKSALAQRMLNHINELALQTRTLALLTDIKEIDAELAAIKASQAAYRQAEQALADSLKAAGAGPQEQQLLKELAEAARQTVPLMLRAAQEGADGATAEASRTLLVEVRPLEATWRRKVAELIVLEQRLNQAAYQQAPAGQRRALGVAGVVVVLAVLAGALLGWRLIRSVKRPIDRAIGLAERIAEGDLATRVEVGDQDEIGRLLSAVAAMQDRLRTLVGQIRQSADSIQLASAEVASGNQDLSQRTEMAAVSLQRTASSMDQLTGTVRQNAEAASQANQLAVSASAVAMRGGDAVGRVVSTMDEINASSRKIGDIIAVIDAIAFQTNILALNAAVEAARAGEQGRGFAVVAGEVRSLAQRSADAAREIKALIGSSVDKVEAGARQVQDAGETMTEIVASVQRVADIIGEITTASSEQSGGLGEINQSVGQLEQMTQQNAALVEQSAAAAQSLREQAGQLAGMVATFRLREGESRSDNRTAA